MSNPERLHDLGPETKACLQHLGMRDIGLGEGRARGEVTGACNNGDFEMARPYQGDSPRHLRRIIDSQHNRFNVLQCRSRQQGGLTDVAVVDRMTIGLPFATCAVLASIDLTP